MRHDHVRPYGTWPPSFVPTARDLREFDARAARSIDPVGGGAYSPTTPLAVGGAGGVSLTTAASTLRNVETRAGGRVEFQTGYPVFSQKRRRTITCPLGPARNEPYVMNLTDSVDGPLGYALNSIGQDLVVIPKRYMHDGSKLVAASIRFRVLTSRTALPSNGPNFIIIYQRGDLMPIDTPQGPLCFWAICSGQFPLPATPAAYYNGGDPQDLVATNFLPDNPTISTGDFYYMIALTGESGGNPDGAPLPRNMFHSITMTFEVQDMRPE